MTKENINYEELVKELDDQLIGYNNENLSKDIKYNKKIEKTFIIGKDCIDKLETLSRYLDITESDAIEYCIRSPAEFNELTKAMITKEIIKNKIEYYNRCYQGKLIRDELLNQKDDIADTVGDAKWDETEEV